MICDKPAFRIRCFLLLVLIFFSANALALTTSWQPLESVREPTVKLQDGIPVAKVKVTVTASNLEEATRLAWREACAVTFGSSVISERASKDGRLQSDFVVASSSCFVISHRILAHSIEANKSLIAKHQLTMEAVTTSSYTDGRILGSDFNLVTDVQPFVAVQSLLAARESQLEYLNAFFSQYPRGAWDIEIESLKTGLDGLKPFAVVTIRAKPNYEFLRGLVEALDAMQVPPFSGAEAFQKCMPSDAACYRYYRMNYGGVRTVRISMRKSGSWLGSTSMLTLSAPIYQHLQRVFGKVNVSGRIDLIAGDGVSMKHACFNQLAQNIFMLSGSGDGKIFGHEWSTYSVRIELSATDLQPVSTSVSVRIFASDGNC